VAIEPIPYVIRLHKASPHTTPRIIQDLKPHVSATEDTQHESVIHIQCVVRWSL